MTLRTLIIVLLSLLVFAGGGFFVWMSAGGGPYTPTGHRMSGSAPLDAKATRLLVLGTSLTAKYDWPDQVAASLSRCIGSQIEVDKIAAVGMNSDWGVAQLQRVEQLQPDVILIEFTINDSDITDGVRLAASRLNHQRLVDHLRDRFPNSRIALVTMSPAQGLRAAVRPFRARYENMYRELAHEFDLDLIDLAPVWKSALEADSADEMLPDGIHPSEDAVKAVAIAPLVERTASLYGLDCDLFAPTGG